MAVSAAVTVFAVRARKVLGVVRSGRTVDRSGEPGRRARRELVQVLGQRKLLQKLGPGAMHALIFWGFLILLPTIVEAGIAIVGRRSTLPLLGRAGWFTFLVDLFASGVVVGVCAAFWIRKVMRPDRFRGSHLGEADRILVWILGIVSTLLLWNAARISLGLAGPGAMPVSNLLAGLFGGGHGTEIAERVLVWSHLLLVLGFLAFLPGSKHLHILTAAPNVYLAKTGPSGRLEPLRIDLESADADVHLGAGVATDLSQKQLLDLFTCTECGRCQEVCPAWATGKPLSPKLLIMDLRDHVAGEAPAILKAAAGTVELQPLVPNAVSDEVVWDCVTCGACVRECPVDIEHVDTIIDLRRHLVMSESRFPTEAGSMLRGIEGPSENPWGQPAAARTEWTEGLGRAGPATGRSRAGGPVLGRLRRRVRRPGPRDDSQRRPAADGRRGRLGDPRCAGAMHRRPGPADGPRVPVPDAGGGQRGDARRGGRDEGRGELRALLQHPRQRVPGLRRAAGGRPPQRAAGRAGRRGPPATDGECRLGHLPRSVLPGPSQRPLRRAA